MKIQQYLLLMPLFIYQTGFSQNVISPAKREHISMDADWRFAFGHPYDTNKDFNFGTAYFSYLAKTGYGDGVATPKFDDRAWRKLDLPHDWAVEQPFDRRASFSHGFKAIGRNFPDASVGWYRKSFDIPASDLGRHISIAFDGVYRNSIVWVNGHYLGTEPSGYSSFEYDISEYLNYGGKNVIAVRVDATMEEGWFYEGAGIYRHTWLNKRDKLHIASNGTFVSTKVDNNTAAISAMATIINTDKKQRNFSVTETVLDADGKALSSMNSQELALKPFETRDIKGLLNISNPKLWSIETPYLHHLVTTIKENGTIIDQYTTTFGIRTIKFDANQGFFLNGKRVEIKGTNNHQDHAGVGSAMPDALQDFRISTLKKMGSNAYRCSHNPPTPELLDACDRLGMFVIDENRLMGVASTELNDLKRMIIRDRNHPSIISWSIGNEEWGIENSIAGARIAETMQTFAKSIDSTRFITAAFSGGVGSGISNVMDLMGYNYVMNKNTDEHHKNHPNQYSWGTEEGSTVATRGAYENDVAKHQRAAYDQKQNIHSLSIEEGWKHYAARPYLAGMYIWTGFDYRGEPTPFDFPSIESYFGMVDACGFPKDDYYYLQSWWTNQTILHLLPHWNWSGKEGQEIEVWAYSNCDEVELFLNKKSMGKKSMELNGHIVWKVNYKPGTLEAIGYKKGVKVATDVVKTTGEPETVQLNANKKTIRADQQDIAMLTLSATDHKNMSVPTADNEIQLSITGPGKIIGVGNGNPVSLEPDKYVDKVSSVKVTLEKEIAVDGMDNRPEITADLNDSGWKRAFSTRRDSSFGKQVKAIVYRGSFDLPTDYAQDSLTFFYNSVGKSQSIYINGKEVAKNLPENKIGDSFKLAKSILKAAQNSIAIVAVPLLNPNNWSVPNRDPGMVQLLSPAGSWKRKLFAGLAQVIVQTTGEAGEITVTATSPGLKPASVKIQSAK